MSQHEDDCPCVECEHAHYMELDQKRQEVNALADFEDGKIKAAKILKEHNVSLPKKAFDSLVEDLALELM
ncbi:MAG: hypothetical protein QM500_12730 [Methylococcales bacterium]